MHSLLSRSLTHTFTVLFVHMMRLALSPVLRTFTSDNTYAHTCTRDVNFYVHVMSIFMYISTYIHVYMFMYNHVSTLPMTIHNHHSYFSQFVDKQHTPFVI